MSKNEKVGSILRDTIERLGTRFEAISRETVETIETTIEEWKAVTQIPADAVEAYNRGVEDAAKTVEELGTNNLGMLHEINAREAAAIRRLKK